MTKPVRLDDLPPAVRKQVERQIGKGATRRLSDAEVSDVGLPVRCHACGEVFASYSGQRGWEGHAKQSGHHRADLVL